MPILTHKTTGSVTVLTKPQVEKLRSQGKIHAYHVEADTPPQIPKEVKKLSAAQTKTAESDTHGTSTTIDGTADGNVGPTE